MTILLTGSTKYEAKITYGENNIFSAEVASQIKQIMRQNGQERYSSIGYPVGVKSGTAQVQNGASENSLLVGFNDDPNLPIAFCVVIEDRVSGEISTSDIVSTMLNALNQN